VDAGYAADQLSRPGTAKLAMAMLDEGTRKRTSLEISESLALLGATLGAGSDLDSSYVSLSALKSKLDPALDIFGDVILNPSFPQADFDRLKKQQLDALQRERSQPVSMALRVFPGLLYGRAHAYGNPFTGTGTETSVAAITRDEVMRFHRDWFKPANATLIVVGDTTLPDIAPRLERLFRGWTAGVVPRKNVGAVAVPLRPLVYLIDRPDSVQSVIFAGHVVPPKANPDEVAIETLNNILGGQFTSRLNLNLREDKHWTYGAGSIIVDARGQRPFVAFAPVQTDKTRESISEILKELREVRGGRPVTAEELAKARDNQALQLPGAWETMDAVAGSIGQLVRFGLPEDHFQSYARRVRALSLDQVAAAVRKVVLPENLVWVVVGDRGKVEPGIRELGLGEIRFIDADGNPVK
jgi:zinc protease